LDCSGAPRRKDPLPLRFPLSRQTAQDGVLSPFSAATRCAGLLAEEETSSNPDCSDAPKKEGKLSACLPFLQSANKTRRPRSAGPARGFFTDS
jgi:hypothetical protein